MHLLKLKINENIFLNLDHVIDFLEVEDGKIDRMLIGNDCKNKKKELLAVKNFINNLLEYFDELSIGDESIEIEEDF
jgi:hypothetical protein